MAAFSIDKQRLIGQYVVDLYSTVTADDEFLITQKYISSLGFDGLLYCLVPNIASGLFKPILNTSDAYSPAFMKHYEEANFQERDFAFNRILSGHSPLVDWWGEVEKNSVKENELEVLQVAREDYNVTNGLSVSTMHSQLGFAGASLISQENAPLFKKLMVESLEVARTILSVYQGKLMTSASSRRLYILPILDRLNETDKKILKYIVTHKTMGRVEDVTGVSPNYANRVIERLKIKLGCTSKHELAYYCGVSGMLDFIS